MGLLAHSQRVTCFFPIWRGLSTEKSGSVITATEEGESTLNWLHGRIPVGLLPSNVTQFCTKTVHIFVVVFPYQVFNTSHWQRWLDALSSLSGYSCLCCWCFYRYAPCCKWFRKNQQTGQIISARSTSHKHSMQQRPVLDTVTSTWHASEYKVLALNQRYTLRGCLCTL